MYILYLDPSGNENEIPSPLSFMITFFFLSTSPPLDFASYSRYTDTIYLDTFPEHHPISTIHLGHINLLQTIALYMDLEYQVRWQAH